MISGFVLLHRKIMGHPLWEEKPFTKVLAWISLIMLANFASGEFRDSKGHLVDGKRGTAYCSIKHLAEEWGWSREKTKKFLEELEREGMVKLHISDTGSKIEIIHYDDYQKWKPRKKKRVVEDSLMIDDSRQVEDATEDQMGQGNTNVDSWFDDMEGETV